MRRCATTAPATTTASSPHLAGTQDRDRRRHHHRDSVAAGQGAEIRQHQSEVAQILRREAALVGRCLLLRDGASSSRGDLFSILRNTGTIKPSGVSTAMARSMCLSRMRELLADRTRR